MKKKLFWAFTLSLVLIFFSSTFSYYFAQDDFFHLKMSQAQSLQDFLSFFSFSNRYGYQFYRPLTTQVFLFLCRAMFGLNPFGFHLVSFLFFLANVYLVFRIIKEFTEEKTALIATAFYALSSINFATLAYISTFEEIGMAFFYFLTIFLYLKKNPLSLLSFVFALASRETAVTLPIIILGIELYQNKKFIKKIRWVKIKMILPHFLVLFSYLFFRLSSFDRVNEFVYQPVLSVKRILNTVFWYTFWSFGAPESLVDFVGPGLKINPRFWQISGLSGKAIVAGSFLLILLSVILFLKAFAQKQIRPKLIFFIFWFLVTLTPFIFLPQHKFVYYLEVPLLGFGAVLSLLLKKIRKLILFPLLIYGLVSFLTINFYKETYWVVGRASLAARLVSEIKKEYPNLPKGATVYFKNGTKLTGVSQQWGGISRQAKVALSDCNALQVIYGDSSIRCLYQDDGEDYKEGYLLIMVTSE